MNLLVEKIFETDCKKERENLETIMFIRNDPLDVTMIPQNEKMDFKHEFNEIDIEPSSIMFPKTEIPTDAKNDTTDYETDFNTNLAFEKHDNSLEENLTMPIKQNEIDIDKNNIVDAVSPASIGESMLMFSSLLGDTQPSKKYAYQVNVFNCDQCPYSTTKRQSLLRHTILHKKSDETDVFLCTSCNFKTKHRLSMRNHLTSNKHIRLGHGSKIEEQKHQCNLCSYTTTSRNNLSKHKSTHNETTERYKCDQCSYETKRKGNMTNHILTHKTIEEVNTFKCELCDFKTKYQSCISTHVLTHKTKSEVKMFMCDKCSYQTKYKKSLTRHVSKTKCSKRVEIKVDIFNM